MGSEFRFDVSDDVYALHTEVCKLFTSPVKLKMLEAFGKDERTVEELSRLIRIRQPNTSQHLSLLRKTGVASARKEGSNVYYALRDPRLLYALKKHEGCAL